MSVPEQDNDLAAVKAAVTILAHLDGRLSAIEAKIEALQATNAEMRHEALRRHLRDDVLTLVGHGIRAAWVFGSQLSVMFMAGYVWFAHQRYVEAIVGWLSGLFS